MIRRLLLLVLLPACAAFAAEMQLYFSALERILADQVFTQDGRLYVKNDAKNRCNFAYLEKPSLAADHNRVVVKSRFSGRAAQSIFGYCVGLGDSFDVLISAIPQYRGGFLALSEVRVDSPGRDSFFVRRVRAAMAESLTKNFKYNVAADAKKLLENPKPDAPIKQELRRFDVSDIRVLGDSLLIVMDFQLAVK